MKHLLAATLLLLPAPLPAAPVLDHPKLLAGQTFWDNRDFGWFDHNIPFLDTPDAELNTTDYYRWELVTKHLTYGFQDTGYLWTEFINRPLWSGAYGGISCPPGHQFYPWSFNLPDPGFEAAWKFLMDPEYFHADFGPTTTERNDPLFLLSPGCCWWSGQSWPFATTQTLKGLAKLSVKLPAAKEEPLDMFKNAPGKKSGMTEIEAWEK